MLAHSFNGYISPTYIDLPGFMKVSSNHESSRGKAWKCVKRSGEHVQDLTWGGRKEDSWIRDQETRQGKDWRGSGVINKRGEVSV